MPSSGISYFEAQRLAAQARANGDAATFQHRTIVASQAALISSIVEMGLDRVRVIVDTAMMDDRRPLE